MKILKCSVTNFASYKNLDFVFDRQGLTLVSGPTGSGKSTLCDVVPWIAFGKTSKGGAVDEIRAWGSIENTKGVLIAEIRPGVCIEITRTRGKGSNDLYYNLYDPSVKETMEDNGVYCMPNPRGKDLTDTQKLINEAIGFDYELYMSAAYFHEFSTTAQFFTTTAKIRRQITEQLVDLSLAKKLVERASDYRKEVKAEVTRLTNELNVTEGILKSLVTSIKSDKKSGVDWLVRQAIKITEVQAKVDDYKSYHERQLAKVLKDHKKRQKELEDELLEIEASLTPESDLTFYRAALKEERQQFELTKGAKCPACGNPANTNKEVLLIKREHELKFKIEANENKKRSLSTKVKELQRHNDSETDLKESHNEENPYIKQLEDTTSEENPYTRIVAKRTKEKTTLASTVVIQRAELNDFKRELSDIELLLDVTDTFRGALVRNTVVDLETNTNQILHDYFDSEIQVKFELSDADKLEATITKDGNVATFTQLSKGQRQLLKLAFGVSIMSCISNQHGINFNALFFDEALDGLDDILKVKAFDLLQQIAVDHESVFVVEHNEALKSLFPKRYEVELTNEGSQLESA